MGREESAGSLADQAAAWVPPWARQAEASRARPEATAAEPADAESVESELVDSADSDGVGGSAGVVGLEPVALGLAALEPVGESGGSPAPEPVLAVPESVHPDRVGKEGGAEPGDAASAAPSSSSGEASVTEVTSELEWPTDDTIDLGKTLAAAEAAPPSTEADVNAIADAVATALADVIAIVTVESADTNAAADADSSEAADADSSGADAADSSGADADYANEADARQADADYASGADASASGADAEAERAPVAGLDPVNAVPDEPQPQPEVKAEAEVKAEPTDQLAVVSDEELRGALEAILLVVDEPVSEIMLAQVVEQPTERVSALLELLAGEYTTAERGFELRRIAGGWRLYTRAQFAGYVEKFVLDGQQVRLTQAALETLAVVAYKQPVTRSRISAIRGVNCDGVVRTLLSRGLIEECGSEPDSGAHLYRTTTLFLEKLGLETLDQLPALAPFLPDDLEALDDGHG